MGHSGDHSKIPEILTFLEAYKHHFYQLSYFLFLYQTDFFLFQLYITGTHLFIHNVLPIIVSS